MKAKVFEFPRPRKERTDPIEFKRPPISIQAKVFMAIVYVLFAVYTGIVIKDLVEGREPPVFDTGGAPRPCAPPSQGVWPDCHESGQK